jgi:ribose transport system permease protein
MALNYVLAGGVVILLQGGVLAVPLHMLDWSTDALKLITLFAVAVLGFITFNFTIYGKQCRAIGSSRETARQTGVNVVGVKFTAFVVMAALAGMLGFFSLIRTGTASSRTGTAFLANAWSAVLLGGVPIEGGATTRFRGAVVGSITMALLNNGMTLMGMDSYAKQFVTGSIFILVIAISFNRKNLTVIK